jgi:phage/plasmid-like protein (TIGR03299 family)
MKSRVESQFVQHGDIGAVYGGTIVDNSLSIDEALKESGLDWEVGVDRVRMAKKTGGKVIPGFFATYRMDTGDPLGIVKTRYNPVQNRDAFAWLRYIIGVDGACVTSAGALHKGRYTWVCIDLGGFDVLPEDAVRKRMLILNSHDGSSNILVQLLPHRIACQNILNFSYGVKKGDGDENYGGGSDPFKIRHTGTAMIKLSEIQRVIGVANTNFDRVQASFEAFKSTTVTPEQNDAIIYAALGVTDEDRNLYNAGEFEKTPQWVNHFGLINDVIEKGPGSDIKGVRGTVWGAFNGINSYFDHIRTVRGSEKNPDNAIESKLMGHSAKMKVKAFDACLNAVEILKN